MKFIEQYFHCGDHLRAILVVIGAIAIAIGLGCGSRQPAETLGEQAKKPLN